jgi:hypothetical protein
LTDGGQTLYLQTARYNQRVCVDLDVRVKPSEMETEGQLVLDIKDDCGVDAEFYMVQGVKK